MTDAVTGMKPRRTTIRCKCLMHSTQSFLWSFFYILFHFTAGQQLPPPEKIADRISENLFTAKRILLCAQISTVTSRNWGGVYVQLWLSYWIHLNIYKALVGFYCVPELHVRRQSTNRRATRSTPTKQTLELKPYLLRSSAADEL